MLSPSLSGSIENLIEYKRCMARGESEMNNKSSSSVISSPKCEPTYSEPVVPVDESTKMLMTSNAETSPTTILFSPLSLERPTESVFSNRLNHSGMSNSEKYLGLFLKE